jgi:hypothetical protein
MRGHARLRLALAALLLLAPMAMACTMGEIFDGCGSHGTEDLTQADLVGTWSGKDAGKLVLRADGSFVATELHEDNRGRVTSGAGTWTLNRTSSTATARTPGVSDVGLVFVATDGSKREWNRIDVDHDIRPVSQLLYLVGDAADCDLRTLVKQPG